MKRPRVSDDFESRKRQVAQDDKNIGNNGSTAALINSIDKNKLDFDLEKVCQLTLSRLNVYCCLVCGRYLQGRGVQTPAFAHSLNQGHRLYANFENGRCYVLPDGYELKDENPILSLVKYNIAPTFTEEQLAALAQMSCRDSNGTHYLPGFIGISNGVTSKIGNYSHISTIVLSFAHIIPLRNYLLLHPTCFKSKSTIGAKLQNLLRKLWSPKLLRCQIGGDELYDLLLVDKHFSNLKADPMFVWNYMIQKLIHSSQRIKDLLVDNLQGSLKVTTSELEKHVHFWHLTLDLPEPSIFKDGSTSGSLPQCTLHELLEKFTSSRSSSKIYTMIELPRYLILHYKRFDYSSLLPVKTRNQTIVEYSTVMKFNSVNYRLVFNIVHDCHPNYNESSKDHESRWKSHIFNIHEKQWYVIDGTHVKPKEKELLFLSETCMQIWEKVTEGM